jgi:hypothetical protein
VDFPRERINHGYCLTRIVDKERLARAVALPHHQIELPSPLAIGFTELTVLEAIGGESLVFLPQQDQGDTLAFELPVHGDPVRDGTSRHRGLGSRGKQLSFQGRVIESVWERPGQTSSLSSPHVLGDGGSADP